jgi:trigger factor
MQSAETKQIEFELADESRQTVNASVKEIKEKVLPPLDDELARAASEFDTLDELRAEIESRLREQVQVEADAAFRAAVVDRLAEAARVEASGPLVETRARELLTSMIRSVERRGIPFETYLTMTGTSPEQIVDRLRAEAKQSVARELVLEAAADQLGIEIDDAQVEELIREQTEAAGEDAAAMTDELRHSGAFEQLREDLRMRDTLDRIAAEVKRIEPELAAARDAIWTPEKESPKTETKLWTPGSKETA